MLGFGEKNNVFIFIFLFFKYCVVLTWKIVVQAEVSVLYIYINY